MQFKQKINGIEYNVTFFACEKKNKLAQVVDQGITFPTRGPPILYLLRFLRSSKKIMVLKIMSLSLLVTKKLLIFVYAENVEFFLIFENFENFQYNAVQAKK